MASVTLPPERIKLLKAVDRAFTHAGWRVARLFSEMHDFRVDCGNLIFFIRCIDETKFVYESAASVVRSLEGHVRELRSTANRQLVVVVGRNILAMDLSSLIECGIFAVGLEDVSIVTDLCDISSCAPGALSERQAWLLKRSLSYATFVSRLYHKERDFASAIEWGRHAVEHSAGYTGAYPWLFQLLKDAGEFDAAAELGERIRTFRPDDRSFLLGMEDLARRRGNPKEAAAWRRRLEEQPTTARSFEDILAKQRAQNKAAPSVPSAPVRSERTDAPRLSWLRGLMRRPSKD